MANITGDANPNVLNGTAARDNIRGLGGDDSLFGNAGNDTLEGGTGADILDGGDGIDRAEYRRSTAGVTVNLALNYGLGGEAQGDTFFSIENVYGSNFADLITGDGANNVLHGRNGNDVLEGGGGNDRLYGGNDNDTLRGGDGADRLYGGRGIDILEGGIGNDRLYGQDGDDNLNGGDGNDRLNGGKGADHLDGGAGTADRAEYQSSAAGVTVDLQAGTGLGGDAQGDTLVNIEEIVGSKHNDILTGNTSANKLYGGNGNDVLNGGAGADYLNGGNGNDELNGGSENDRLYGGSGVDVLNGDGEDDYLNGGNGDDTLNGGDGADRLYGGNQNDTLNGDAGEDYLNGGNGNDELNGGSENDRLYGGNGVDQLNGDDGNDYLNGGKGNDTLEGDLGDDTLIGHNDNDTLRGGEGNDTLNGGRGNDILEGGDDNDTLIGHDGNDDLDGGDGNDVLDGGKGDDDLDGGAGDDILKGGAGADDYDGGTGTDTLDYSRSRSGVKIDLDAGTAEGGDAQGDTLTNVENVIGTRRADELRGDAGANTLTGNNGNDLIEGDAGNDVLSGGNGRDTLDGGEGDDTLDGGRGADTLTGGLGDDLLKGGDSSDIYKYDKGDGHDTIQDAGHRDRDVIEISGYDPDKTFIQRDAANPDTLIISFGGEDGGDTITVVNTLGGSNADTIEQIKFDDGTIWNIADVISDVANAVPVAVDDDGGEVFVNNALVLLASDLLNNDTDADPLDTLTMHSVHDAVNGTVSLDGSGNITFTPDSGYSGPASFKYTVTDGTAAAEATVSLDVKVEFTTYLGNWWSETIDLSSATQSYFIDCGLGNDIVTGSDFRDAIDGGGGDDDMSGGGGNDDFLIDLNDGYDRFDGGAGYDKVLAQADNVKIGLIGDFNDSVEEFSCAGFANISILGTWQTQVLDFSNVVLTDIAYIDAHYGNDTVIGSAGDDVIIGHLGDDTVSGGAGDDDFLVGLNHGFDTFDGGAGYDQVIASEANVNIGLLGNFNASVEEFSAGGFSDVTITGNWQAQIFDFTGVTLDNISSINLDGGNDTATGSAGDDVIIGGTGNDTLAGALGADTFVFRDGDGQDVLSDFDLAEDVVRLDAVAGFDDFADVQAALSQDGTDALLDLTGGQTVLFENVLVAALTTDHFEFA